MLDIYYIRGEVFCQENLLFLTTNYTNFSNMFLDKDLGKMKTQKWI